MINGLDERMEKYETSTNLDDILIKIKTDNEERQHPNYQATIKKNILTKKNLFNLYDFLKENPTKLNDDSFNTIIQGQQNIGATTYDTILRLPTRDATNMTQIPELYNKIRALEKTTNTQ